jgi:hypothetical protein
MTNKISSNASPEKWRKLYVAACALFALCLLVYHCVSWLKLSSAGLQVLEFTLRVRFDSRLPPHQPSSVLFPRVEFRP